MKRSFALRHYGLLRGLSFCVFLPATRGRDIKFFFSLYHNREESVLEFLKIGRRNVRSQLNVSQACAAFFIHFFISRYTFMAWDPDELDAIVHSACISRCTQDWLSFRMLIRSFRSFLSKLISVCGKVAYTSAWKMLRILPMCTDYFVLGPMYSKFKFYVFWWLRPICIPV